jgi:HPr kinase/phosphorylase
MPLTVRQFYDEGREALDLRVAQGGEHLDREIEEPSFNRPGLAFSGFFRYFAHRRIQVLGLAEMTYLKSLAPAVRRERLSAFYGRQVPCLLLARSFQPPKDLASLARRHGVSILRSGLVTGELLRRAAVIIETVVSPRQRVQGTMVDILGLGVLIEGEPGVGKSETALGLVRRGYSLVADDLTVLQRRATNTLFGSASEATRYHMEIRGLGIIHVPSLFGVASVREEKRLDLIVRLVRAMPQEQEERTGLTTVERDVLGVPVPCVTIPVAPGRDTTNIVEAAALNHRLKQLGHDAVKELDARMMRRLAGEAVRQGD